MGVETENLALGPGLQMEVLSKKKLLIDERRPSGRLLIIIWVWWKKIIHTLSKNLLSQVSHEDGYNVWIYITLWSQISQMKR